MTPSPLASGGHDLLFPDEPASVEIVTPDAPGPVVLTCDHASNRMPRRCGTLGLDDAALQDHIAWDPGAAPVARRMAALLDAPLVLSGYSRLVRDCNRPAQAPSAVPPISAGTLIPGNEGIDDAERAAREAALFVPYHAAITAILEARRSRDMPTALMAIHSFTPDYPGLVRPWRIGIAYHRDARFARLLIDGLRADDPDLTVGDNEPYKVDDESDYTIPVHGEARGLPHVLVEIRNDGLKSPADQEGWADRLVRVVRRLLPALAHA
jgi:predicted N-formylglutamate amidohydrolase